MSTVNEQIANFRNLWDEYFNTSAFQESDFSALTYAERLEMLNAAYPDDETHDWGYSPELRNAAEKFLGTSL